jgi:metallo-beta-lactamase family protein
MATAILRFLGAAGTVTGSRFLVDTPGAKVLVDCGLFQGAKDLRKLNWAPFPLPPAAIDAVVLTHAHLDHVGYLPALVRDGFDGPVFCTARTAELAAIVLADSARLQEEEANYANRKRYSKHHPALPLYTQEDAAAAVERLTTVHMGDRVEVASGIHAVLYRAGHILGSAGVSLSLDNPGRRLFFSGDVGRPNHPVLRPPDPPPGADLLLTESTYGNRVHDDEAAALTRLADVVTRTARRGGVVVVPAFAVDRTEVVLLALARLAAEKRIPRLPVYADSPMALAVLDVYRKAIADGDPELRLRALDSGPGSDPFDPAGELHEASTPDDSRALNDLGYPSIIISASGMATGGRVLHHLLRTLPEPRNSIVLAGYQAEGTRGRALADGARAVKLLGRYVPVRAEIEVIDAFSVHADADELVGWLGRSDHAPDTAFVVHGEPAASAALGHRLEAELGWTAVVPAMGEQVRID